MLTQAKGTYRLLVLINSQGQPKVTTTANLSGNYSTGIGQQPTTFVNVSDPTKVTNANGDMNMDNVHFRVSMSIQLGNDIYRIYYIPTSSDDLYFGDVNANPIPTPVNAGTYDVWLSQTGYNNIVNGNNFWISKNGGKFQFFAKWDIMSNIDIGPYNPVNFGHGTYTITPYHISAVITGNQTLTADQPTLKPSNYQISFSGMDKDSLPFDQVTNNFTYTFQNGDLVLDPAILHDNQYQVILSEQGLTNIRAALVKVFNNFADNFSLLMTNVTNNGIATVVNDPLTITRTIIVNYPDGRIVPYQQTATLTRPYHLNDSQTGIVFGPWSTAQWPSFQVPRVNGYFANPRVVSAVTVISDTTNTTVNVHYQPVNHPADQTQPGQPVSSAKGLSGAHNQVQTATHATTGQQASTTNQKLPQTGATETTKWSLMGLMLLGLTSLLGVVSKRQS